MHIQYILATKTCYINQCQLHRYPVHPPLEYQMPLSLVMQSLMTWMTTKVSFKPTADFRPVTTCCKRVTCTLKVRWTPWWTCWKCSVTLWLNLGTTGFELQTIWFVLYPPKCAFHSNNFVSRAPMKTTLGHPHSPPWLPSQMCSTPPPPPLHFLVSKAPSLT